VEISCLMQRQPVNVPSGKEPKADWREGQMKFPVAIR
jgi:hypothetical protein